MTPEKLKELQKLYSNGLVSSNRTIDDIRDLLTEVQRLHMIEVAAIALAEKEILTIQCKCGKAGSGGATCPYSFEINDTVIECDCCADCQYECSRAI